MEILVEEFGEALLGLLAGAAALAMFTGLLNYVTSF